MVAHPPFEGRAPSVAFRAEAGHGEMGEHVGGRVPVHQHPVAAVHYSVPTSLRELGRITTKLIRIEDVEDIVEDLGQALHNS